MQKILIIHLLITLGMTQLIIAQSTWQVKSGTKVNFKIKNAGFNVNGSFQGLKASIQFEAENLKTSNMTASLEVNTIDTGIGSRDRHLKSDDYFDAPKYPKITMKSKRFARSESGNFIGVFDLTIRNITKEIKIPFKFTQKGETALFDGQLTINRLDYGVGKSSVILSDNVTIYLKIEVAK